MSLAIWPEKPRDEFNKFNRWVENQVILKKRISLDWISTFVSLAYSLGVNHGKKYHNPENEKIIIDVFERMKKYDT